MLGYFQNYVILFLSLMFNTIVLANEPIKPLPELGNLYQNMKKTLPLMCHQALDELDYVTVKYWGFDNREYQGALLIHRELSRDIVYIFDELYSKHFPIYKMQSPEIILFSEDEIMAKNITVSFNCREVTGQQGILSQHSYGRAIDINPLINPYVKGKLIIPPQGEEHIARNAFHPGKITQHSFIYALFTSRGWDWGGNWNDLQDFQHFEKRANGEVRPRDGYK
jgi:hypothetical protein